MVERASLLISKSSILQRIYTAGSLAEAYLVQQLLESESISAIVFNENAQGAVGELPSTEVWPEIWIEDGSCGSVAHSIIQRYETNNASDTVILCGGCGEQNPGNFELCWRCGNSVT